MTRNKMLGAQGKGQPKGCPLPCAPNWYLLIGESLCHGKYNY